MAFKTQVRFESYAARLRSKVEWLKDSFRVLKLQPRKTVIKLSIPFLGTCSAWTIVGSSVKKIAVILEATVSNTSLSKVPKNTMIKARRWESEAVNHVTLTNLLGVSRNKPSWTGKQVTMKLFQIATIVADTTTSRGASSRTTGRPLRLSWGNQTRWTRATRRECLNSRPTQDKTPSTSTRFKRISPQVTTYPRQRHSIWTISLMATRHLTCRQVSPTFTQIIVWSATTSRSKHFTEKFRHLRPHIINLQLRVRMPWTKELKNCGQNYRLECRQELVRPWRANLAVDLTAHSGIRFRLLKNLKLMNQFLRLQKIVRISQFAKWRAP